MKIQIILSFYFFAPAVGFRPISYHHDTARTALKSLKDAELGLSIHPFEDRGVDLVRARQCAEHFGQCSIEEMQQLHDALHKERLQNFMFGGHGLTEPSEDALQHRFLEDELELQLHLLKDQEPKSTLFPEVEPEMAELPHLKDKKDAPKVEKAIRNAERELVFKETFLEEGVLETIAMCLAVAFLVALPNLLSK